MQILRERDAGRQTQRQREDGNVPVHVAYDNRK
jgi:hypothetical protein